MPLSHLFFNQRRSMVKGCKNEPDVSQVSRWKAQVDTVNKFQDKCTFCGETTEELE